MQKVIISDYLDEYFGPSIIVNISNKPFWFLSYGANFYAHSFDRYMLNDDDGFLEIRDDYYKQISLNNIITESNGSDDYKALNPNCIAFALYSGFSWHPSEVAYEANYSGACNGSIYTGTEINSNQPDVYMGFDYCKMLTSSYFNSLSDTTKLEFIRQILPFYSYENNKVALNLSYKLQASGKSGIKSGQFIL